jgi:hypothetical protein
MAVAEVVSDSSVGERPEIRGRLVFWHFAVVQFDQSERVWGWARDAPRGARGLKLLPSGQTHTRSPVAGCRLSHAEDKPHRTTR